MLALAREPARPAGSPLADAVEAIGSAVRGRLNRSPSRPTITRHGLQEQAPTGASTRYFASSMPSRFTCPQRAVAGSTPECASTAAPPTSPSGGEPGDGKPSRRGSVGAEG
jgi:hypothetical protein